MEYRRLGRTQLQVSAVGFGTCQLRLMPEKQAIDMLLKGFDLGVNIVHTSPEYEKAEGFVAKAVERTDRKIIVASQGYDTPGNEKGHVRQFEALFEATCKLFRTDRLDLYGISGIDNAEAFKENVWGENGMIEFLRNKKEEGRLGGIFCSTHGAPEYVKQLITSGVFDAIMIAYNILGYHLLSCNPPPGRHFECIPRNKHEIFPLCQKHDVGLMIMKPLAGGLLCNSRAFPPNPEWETSSKNIKATDILRSILINPEVTCVLPGTISIQEAEENALSGYAPIALGAEQRVKIEKFVKGLEETVCSRCGACDKLCSQGLPVSWIFRAALINLHPSAVFEALEHMEYFKLHPQLKGICATCPSVTCVCPRGINIPKNLTEIHGHMVDLMHRQLIPPPDAQKGSVHGDYAFAARIVTLNIPQRMSKGATNLFRLCLENAGLRGWLPDNKELKARVDLGIFVDEQLIRTVRVPHDVHNGDRCHLAFELTAPRDATRFHLRLQLLGEHEDFSKDLGIVLVSKDILVDGVSSNRLCTNMERISSGLARRCRKLPGQLPGLLKGLRTEWMSLQERFYDKIARHRPSANTRELSTVPEATAHKDANPPPVSAPETSLNASNSTDLRPPYAVAWLENNLPTSFPKGGLYQVYMYVENQGSRTWLAHHPEDNSVHLVIYIGETRSSFVRIPYDVHPGQKVILTFPFSFPKSAENGHWNIKFSLVELNVAWFDQNGVEPLVVHVRAEEPEKGAVADAIATARHSNWGFWQPSQGISRSRTGIRYPLFAKHAEGSRIRDLEGNEWIDYVMGGGSAILGYAHPEIQDAVAQQLSSSAVVTLPHLLEIRVTEMLCEMIPCAEMVLFGKHGSDACTAAIRTARLHTGRSKVLFSGYHGWHDWNIETLQPRLRISTEPPSLFRFGLNDASLFRALVKEHSGSIGAVILEPVAQAPSLEGPVCDVDPEFLREVADLCRQEGAVLIFDEIITGFRHPHGSVQQATGVIPDLACFGKALSAGMPLSALVGRREIMKSSLQIAYMPTFRGEVYSLAAAAAALQIYRRQDVPGMIHTFGLELKDAINHISRELGVEGEMIGVPYRMIYKFNEPDELRRILKRTFLQQELLQRGVLTFNGYMLPSLAHGNIEMEQTISAFRAALQRVQEVSSEQTFARYLDIPLI